MQVPLYYESEMDFEKRLDKRFINDFELENNKYSEQQLIDFQSLFDTQYPRLYKYNNILGYAELVLDTRDILIYYYLNGDRRKIYNKHINFRTYKRNIYSPTGYIYGGTIEKLNKREIKVAFEDSFKEIENQCKEWKIYVNLKRERELINYIDFERLIKNKNLL